MWLLNRVLFPSSGKISTLNRSRSCGQNHALFHKQLFSFWETVLGSLLRSRTDLTHDYKTPSNQVTREAHYQVGVIWLPAKGRHAHPTFISNLGWYRHYQAWEGPEYTIYGGGTHTQDDHSCCPSLTPQQTPGLHAEFPHSNCLRRKNIKPGWYVFFTDILISHKIALLMVCIFHLGWSWRTMGMRTPPKRRKVKHHGHCWVISGKWLSPSRVGGSDDVWLETRSMLSLLQPSYCIHVHLHKRRK